MISCIANGEGAVLLWKVHDRVIFTPQYRQWDIEPFTKNIIES